MPFTRVVHLTSAHPREDTRILVKQCRSLATAGYAVTLVVADGKGDAAMDGIDIVDVGKPGGRLQRVAVTTRRILGRALALDAELYHLHDPELLPVGLRLRRLGKRVIFDSHEDVPRQILAKSYLPRLLRGLLAAVYERFERHACPSLDGIVAATPVIRDRFLAIHPRTVDVDNFPIIGELETEQPWANKGSEVCYVGGIAAIRGIVDIVRACEWLRTPTRINLAGRFTEPATEKAVKLLPGWSRINVLGQLDRAGVRAVLGQSFAGLVTLHPTLNYLEALPVKMFEYMAAGIPVIASDFPLWRAIVEASACGICVDPQDPRAIAEAIDYLAEHPDEARRMGSNGRAAVAQRYNWANEEDKLLDFYADILAAGTTGPGR